MKRNRFLFLSVSRFYSVFLSFCLSSTYSFFLFESQSFPSSIWLFFALSSISTKIKAPNTRRYTHTYTARERGNGLVGREDGSWKRATSLHRAPFYIIWSSASNTPLANHRTVPLRSLDSILTRRLNCVP